MVTQSKQAGPSKKPQLTDADKALLEAEPDWERMGEAAKRLLRAEPKLQGVGKQASDWKEP